MVLESKPNREYVGALLSLTTWLTGLETFYLPGYASIDL